MASPSFAPPSAPVRRIPLAEIDALVSARLGPTRGLGNSQPACFNRQVAMYLAARVGRWSTTAIGRFYGGRDHSTVCYGIQRIESLSESDSEVDALLADLKRQLGERTNDAAVASCPEPAIKRKHEFAEGDMDKIASVIAERVFTLLSAKLERRFSRAPMEEGATTS
jgi:hypothetical protein